MNLFIDILIAILFISSIIAIFDTSIKFKLKKARLFGEENKTNEISKKISENKFISNYQNLLYNALQKKNKEHLANNFLLAIVVLSVLIFAYFININQYFFAVVMPVALNYIILATLKEMKYDINYEIEKQLPTVIDDIIQKFSRYNDLKTVIYEVSNDIDNPLKNYFEKLYKNMFFQNQNDALMEFANKIDNIWVHSLVFILTSYGEDTKKELVIENLKNLRDLIVQERELQSKKTNDNRYGVALNYFICIATFIANIIVILLVPNAQFFFFKDTNGILCFIVGYAMLFVTLICNLRNQFRKRR